LILGSIGFGAIVAAEESLLPELIFSDVDEAMMALGLMDQAVVERPVYSILTVDAIEVEYYVVDAKGEIIDAGSFLVKSYDNEAIFKNPPSKNCAAIAYRDKWFGGASIRFSGYVYCLNGSPWNNQVSSLCLEPHTVIRAYDQCYFTGQCWTFHNNTNSTVCCPDLSWHGANDKISSVYVGCC